MRRKKTCGEEGDLRGGGRGGLLKFVEGKAGERLSNLDQESLYDGGRRR